MAERGIRLVYGGGRVGLMGAVADAAQEAGGAVTGVIPEFLMKRELGNDRIDALEVTDNMHSRKQRMFELADAFVTLAGGLGTLDETVEVITWKQLRLHSKPIVVISIDGHWDFLRDATRNFTKTGFAYASAVELFDVVTSVAGAFRALEGTLPGTGGGSEDKL